MAFGNCSNYPTKVGTFIVVVTQAWVKGWCDASVWSINIGSYPLFAQTIAVFVHPWDEHDEDDEDDPSLDLPLVAERCSFSSDRPHS